MAEVVDLTRKRIEKRRKQKLQKELETSIYHRPPTTEDKINQALRKFGSFKKNPNNDPDKKDKE